MKISTLPWAVKIETERYVSFLSASYNGWRFIHFLPGISLDRHYLSGNYTLYLSFLCLSAWVDIHRKDKFQA